MILLPDFLHLRKTPHSLENILRIHHLVKDYGRIRAVNDLSLDIPKGSVFGILGPNGSGKTTTLGIVLGVTNGTSGTYEWFGEAPAAETRKRIGAILETPVFYPYLTAVQNLELVAMIKGHGKSNIPSVLEKVGLTERMHSKFKTFSLGMKQRLAIASALLADPEVLVLDEPTNGLDPQGIAEIRNLITDIAKSGKTILLASHLLDEVQKVCTHFSVLRRGHLLFTGSVEEVSNSAITIEVNANISNLEEILLLWPAVTKINATANGYELIASANAASLNQFLFEKGVVASHLITKKKTLEKQFLELLAEEK
jgi:ABC-type multidrug transport system ATPase subunit